MSSAHPHERVFVMPSDRYASSNHWSVNDRIPEIIKACGELPVELDTIKQSHDQ